MANIENTPEKSIEELIDMLPSWDDPEWEEQLHKIVIRVDYVKSELKARLVDGVLKV